MELKREIEALLFSAGRKISVDELARITKATPEAIKERLLEIKREYDEKEKPIMIVEENNEWKMTTREKYLGKVRKITPQMEFPKTLMETLAVIAWKQPILQSDVIKVRTNKAYDHIVQLVNLGFVVKEKFSRTYKLKLTQKFFDYFDLRNDKDVEKLFARAKGKQEVEKGLEEEKMAEEYEKEPERKEKPEEEKEETVYDEADKEELLDNDEITKEEDGFMKGEEEAAEEPKKEEKNEKS